MLSYRETQIVKGMLNRGDRQHDIAAYFGVNGGRIAEIANGQSAYSAADAAEPAKLPPPGPYLTKFALQSVVQTLNEAIETIEMAEAEKDLGDVKAALALAKETLRDKTEALRAATA